MAHPQTDRIILIGGPTASGKSAYALKMAKEIGGAIINADAMQIYAGLPLLTAQPDAEDKKTVPHFLYEVCDPAEASSAGKWLTLATDAIANCRAQGLIPILVGGTGLYFAALLGGLADIPAVPDEIRQETQTLYDKLGDAAFRKELAKLDPDSAAKFAPNDRQRSIRAFEVARATGKALSLWQKEAAASNPYPQAERFVLSPPREKLYAACDARFLQMMGAGAIEEVKRLSARNLSPDRPVLKILGVREIASYLRHELSLNQAIAKAQQATRNYAKRQVTWFKNQWPASTVLTR